MTKREKIVKLRNKRDVLWKKYCHLPRRDSFSALHISGQLNKVQQKLDKLEGDKRSKRYYPEINVEVF
ncbi:MAG: hypothetical protein Q8L47_02255 [bacterium]|nr:hypothetical protein [bacterium]